VMSAGLIATVWFEMLVKLLRETMCESCWLTDALPCRC
jgi:hypothetical protein